MLLRKGEAAVNRGIFKFIAFLFLGEIPGLPSRPVVLAVIQPVNQPAAGLLGIFQKILIFL